MVAGASNEECSNTYAGPEAFSEPETLAFSRFVDRYKDSIKLYLSVHSYGQYIIYPWSYTTVLPDDWEELDDLAQATASAIYDVQGTRYTVGNSVELLYYAAGCSDDWVKGAAGVELTFVIELPGGGSFGFDLPSSRIPSVVNETWQGILVLQDYVTQKFGQTNITLLQHN